MMADTDEKSAAAAAAAAAVCYIGPTPKSMSHHHHRHFFHVSLPLIQKAAKSSAYFLPNSLYNKFGMGVWNDR